MNFCLGYENIAGLKKILRKQCMAVNKSMIPESGIVQGILLIPDQQLILQNIFNFLQGEDQLLSTSIFSAQYNILFL